MNSGKNVLFVSYDGMTDPLGQSQVIPYMQGLTKAGYHVTILSCEKKQVYEVRKEVIRKILDESGIEWVPLNYTKNPPVLSGWYDLYRLKRAAGKIHLQKRIDLVHTRAGTPAMLGLWMKKKYGVKFLNDLRDFFADSRVDSGAWDQRSFVYRWVYRYFKKAEASQLQNSDGIVCLTNAAKAIIEQWPEYKAEIPLSVIPCSVDLDLFSPENTDEKQADNYRDKLDIQKTDIIISYLGSIGGWYLTAEMMQFFQKMMQKIPGAKFLFISPHSHEYILDTARKYDVPADKIISVKGYRPEIPVLLSLSHYSIFFIKPCYSKQASSPTKHGELMAMGIPVITNSGVGDVAGIVQKYNSGIVADDFSETTFDNIIQQMENIIFDEKEIRKGAVEFYSLDSAIALYTSMYKQILKN